MVDLVVNGQRHTIAVADEVPLLLVLRNELGLYGARAGCAVGECGACTVIADGEAVRSCLLPLGDAAGQTITTPEGLGVPGSPHPVQQAFLDEQAAQCGYCTNGMIMTVAAALASDEPPDDDAAMRQVLDENLCRCGTHRRVLRAFRRAAGLPNDESWTLVDVGPAGTADESPPELPAAVSADPRVERWIGLGVDGIVEARPGKVELGQGIRTALAQVVASHLGLSPDCVRVLSASTDSSPDLGTTAGSRSIEDAGTALAIAAVAFRRLLLARAAARLGVPADHVRLDPNGWFCVLDVPKFGHIQYTERVSLAELAAEGAIVGRIEATDRLRWDRLAQAQPVRRDDLRAKLTGAPAYVQDLALPGMLHARAFLPPSLDAWPEGLDLASVRKMPGVVHVVEDGRLVIVVAETEHQAVRALARLERDVRWRCASTPAWPVSDVAALLRDLPAEPHVVRQDMGVDRALADGRAHSASYTKPHEVHGPMGPSAAVAHDDGNALRVWTHAQGVYPLRRELATLLSLEEDRIVVEHLDGPGCYGMNGADDAAALAAVAARAVPGRPVRFQHTMADEMAWDPTGPAMVADLAASLDEHGHIRAWRHHAITDAHVTRPDGSGDKLLVAWLRAEGPDDRPWPGPAEPGARNAAPPYDVPLAEVMADHVRGPLRTGPLRTLGSYLNVFAGESFMDELAERAGEDPLAFRLAHLSDPRARRVMEVAAERAGWTPHVGPSGRGMGVAFARYKGAKAYVAEVAEVDVDVDSGEIAVRRVTVVADAGTIVDPDGLANQLEGGVVQGLSRAMHEQLRLAEGGGHTARGWADYPVIRFRHVPEIDVVMLDRPGSPPLGAGEASTPPVPAAVANAIDDAIGVRVRDLPLTPARLRQRLYDLTPEESTRVRLP